MIDLTVSKRGPSQVSQPRPTKKIDEKFSLEVNGCTQWVFVRGNANKPILFFVHGGPGLPFTPIARAFESTYLNDFLVVHWDQRGAGKSYKGTDFSKGFSINQFAEDGLFIVRNLRHRYDKQPVILVAHSWGTIIGLKMTAKEPTLFRSYISVGTNTDSLAAETYRYTILRKRIDEKGDQADILAIDALGRPPWSFEQYSKWAILTQKYVPFRWVWGPIPASQVEKATQICIDSGDYTGAELEIAFSEGISKSVAMLLSEYNSFDALTEVTALDVPTFFVQGELDFNTPGHIVKRYYDALSVPKGKSWTELKGHGHMVLYEAPKQFLQIFRKAAKH